MNSEKLWMCRECDEITLQSNLLTAVNPFDNPMGKVSEIKGCPSCHAIDDFIEICDEPKCYLPASCGFPTKDGYRRTCLKHSTF